MKNYWKKEFASRFRWHEDELKRMYCELYHSDMKAYDAFTDMLYRAWEQRPEGLKALDREREDHPGWYKGQGLVGMTINVNAFGGNLKGVEKKLDYIADCGVNFLHLTPLLQGSKGPGGEGGAVSDFRRVQPELGDMEDFSRLAQHCHARGISLCLDFIMNHTSQDHQWARRARAGEKEYQDRYFFFDGWIIPSAFEQTLPQKPPAAAPGNFTWCEEAKKVIMTTIHPCQWDLNYANPAVFNDMTDNMLFLCNQGADVIRLGALPYIWKALGTSCRNLRQAHSLTRILRMVCEIVCPGALLLGETAIGPGEAAPYFGTVDKPECHLLYSAAIIPTLWHTVGTRDVRLLAHQLRQIFSQPKEYAFLHGLRSPHGISWELDYAFLRQFGQEEGHHKRYLNDYFTGLWPGSPARGELYNGDSSLGDARLCGTTASLCGLQSAREKGDPAAMDAAIRLDQALHAFIFSLSGMPLLYGGDEIGLENNDAYRSDPLKREDRRYLHQGNMDWKKAALRKRKTPPEGRIFAAIRQLEALRASHAVFDAGADTWLLDTGSDQMLGIGRYYQGEQLLALFNFDDREHTARIGDNKRYIDLMTGQESDGMAVRLPARGFRWLLHQFE